MIWLLLPGALLTAAGCSEISASMPKTPDGTVEYVAAELAENRPNVAWRALPASYRKDVSDLVHEFADQVDRELWNKSVDLIRKLTRVLEEKKTFILDHPTLAQQITDRAETEKNWDSVVEILNTLLESEICDLDKLRTIDIDRWTSKTGVKVMNQMSQASALSAENPWKNRFKSRLRSVRASVVKSDGHMATLRIESDAEPAHEELFVRVEDRWVPKEMADAWDAKISEAKQNLAAMSTATIAEHKQQVLMTLGMVDGILNTLLEADTAEQFHNSVNQVLPKIMMGMMGGAVGPPPPIAPGS